MESRLLKEKEMTYQELVDRIHGIERPSGQVYVRIGNKFYLIVDVHQDYIDRSTYQFGIILDTGVRIKERV